MERLPRRHLVAKLVVLTSFVLYSLYTATATSYQSNDYPSLNRHADSHVTKVHSIADAIPVSSIDSQYRQMKGGVDVAKLLLHPLRQRSLTPREEQEDASFGDPYEKLASHLRPVPEGLLNNLSVARNMTMEECLYIWGSAICKQHPQPMLKNNAFNDTAKFTIDDCRKIWGHMVCERLFLLVDLTEFLEASNELDKFLYTNEADDKDDDFTKDDCLLLWEPPICDAIFKIWTDNEKRHITAHSQEPRGQRGHCKKRPYSPLCRSRKVKPTNTVNHSTRRFGSAKHLEYPRWENSTDVTGKCEPVDHDKFIHMSIDDGMHNQCPPKSRIHRTWIDLVLPPHECDNYRASLSDFKKCLSVSNVVSPSAIVAYVVIGIVSTCSLGLLVLACIRRRRRSLSPLHKDVDRLGANSGPKQYGETRTIDSDRPYSRRYSDTVPYQGAFATLDGANDGWTKWILGRGHNEKSRVSQPRPVPAPRIPSLRLPKPTFATVRKVSGLEPDNYTKQKSRPSKGTSRLLRWGSNF